VAVGQDKWPTAAAVQRAIKSLEYPLALVSSPDQPFSLTDGSCSLPVVFEGRPVELEAEIDRVTEIDDPESLFGYIAACSAPKFKIRDGDYFLTLTFRSDADRMRAGLYLAAALILTFDGYGFENQFESHGGADFANQLVAEAANASAFED
jgi:hypothetical protein